MGPDIIFLIPIVAVPSIAAVLIAFSPLGKALAGRRRAADPDPALLAALESQEARLVVAEDEIEKLREKLEFHERLLAGPDRRQEKTLHAGPESRTES